MRGITKAFSRAPHLITSKVGMSHKSSDAQFDELARRFGTFEKTAEKLKKDATSYRDSVQNMLVSGASFGTNFQALFTPIGSEGDLLAHHPEAERTLTNLPEYDNMLASLRDTLTPEIELIENRIVAPLKDFHAVCLAIRKNITKRDHKLVDYDRHKNSYEKLKNKTEKSLKEEQHLFKVEQDYETSMADYEYFNNALKEELPHFFDLAAAFVKPLFHSFYYMQLNVLYLTLDSVQNFAEGRYELHVAQGQIESDYEAALGDALEKLDNLSIRRPATSSARILTQNGRTLGPARTGSGAGSGGHGLAAHAPSKGGLGAGASSGAGVGRSSTLKKGPPPPIPGKKPGMDPEPTSFVIALYDYNAQADGDLTFAAGDRIEVVQRTASQDDWWTGVVHGVQGIFPGNYVRDP